MMMMMMIPRTNTYRTNTIPIGIRSVGILGVCRHHGHHHHGSHSCVHSHKSKTMVKTCVQGKHRLTPLHTQVQLMFRELFLPHVALV